MTIVRPGTLGITCALAALVAVSVVQLGGQSAPVPSSRAASARTAPAQTSVAPSAVPAGSAVQRELLDKYCVTCHNDRVKTANLSLQGADLSQVGEHADFWEKVVRKLRAGVMPPPDMPRPSLVEYDGLRDWLEREIDRKAAGRVFPGSVVLHRLNRTEYANAIRDLLDLEIDVTTLLPPDDSARAAG